jgi:peptidyl-prolyl cis-trans isomerase B (cyclophilin B)
MVETAIIASARRIAWYFLPIANLLPFRSGGRVVNYVYYIYRPASRKLILFSFSNWTRGRRFFIFFINKRRRFKQEVIVVKWFKYVVWAAVAAALAVSFAGCRKKLEEPATAETVETAAEAEVPETPLALSPEAQKLPPGTEVAVLDTDKGVIEIELLTKETPQTAANFIKLVEDKFYDGIPFHRVEPGFVVQAGDATLVGRENPAVQLPVEADKRKTVRGAVSMARSMAPGATEYGETSPTQFFILTGDSPHLDPDFCVFGVVVSGMDVVDNLRQGDVIKRARVLTVGEEESVEGTAEAE